MTETSKTFINESSMTATDNTDDLLKSVLSQHDFHGCLTFHKQERSYH